MTNKERPSFVIKQGSKKWKVIIGPALALELYDASGPIEMFAGYVRDLTKVQQKKVMVELKQNYPRLFNKGQGYEWAKAAHLACPHLW